MLELNVTSPQALSYPNTNVGLTSAATVTQVANQGNASLVLTGLAASNTNYTIAAASTCTATSTVTAAGSCHVDTQFTPLITTTPGTVTASVTLTDNQLAYALNTATSNETATFGTSGTQALNLSGTALAAGTVGTTPQTITFTPPTSPVTYGVSPITLSASSTSGLGITFVVTSGPANHHQQQHPQYHQRRHGRR